MDKTIQITREDKGLKFVEQGETKAKAVTIVVGQTVRWENKCSKDHRVVSDLKVDRKPVFDTGIIKPGEHKDILVDFQMYRKAGGKPANVVKFKYHGADHMDDKGEYMCCPQPGDPSVVLEQATRRRSENPLPIISR